MKRREPEAMLLMPNLGAPRSLPRNLTVREEGVSVEDYATARDVIYSMLHRWGRSEVEFAENRYVFHVLPLDKRFRSGWKTDTWCRVAIEPIGGKLVPDERGYFEKQYKRPSGRVLKDGIVNDRRLSYRGMSWEEWQFIRGTGKIASAGWYNLGQEGYTFFGEAANAEYYANSFSPWMYKPGKQCPGVVIAVPKSITVGNSHDPKLIPENERAIQGAVSAGEIVGVWYLIAQTIYSGEAEIKKDGQSGYADVQGGSTTPSVSHVTIEADDWYG